MRRSVYILGNTFLLAVLRISRWLRLGEQSFTDVSQQEVRERLRQAQVSGLTLSKVNLESGCRSWRARSLSQILILAASCTTMISFAINGRGCWGLDGPSVCVCGDCGRIRDSPWQIQGSAMVVIPFSGRQIFCQTPLQITDRNVVSRR